MLFYYKAVDNNGKLIEGTYEADSTADVLEFLLKRGLKPVSLKKEKTIQKKIFRFFAPSINLTDKVFLTKYLALMLKVGTDLFRAINILIDDFDKPAVKKILTDIKNSLEKGQPFYLAFLKYPKSFPPVFVNLVKAGEASGNLEKVLNDLSISLQKEAELKRKIKSSLTYPVLLVGLSLLILFFLVGVALPRIANVFLTSNIEPPFLSRIVFAVAQFLNDNFLLIIIIAFCLLVGSWFFFFKNKMGKRVGFSFLKKLPILGKLLEKIVLQRFAATLSSLLFAGLPILKALSLTSEVVGDEEVKRSLNLVIDKISKGKTIGEAFKEETVFPKVVVSLIAIAEKGGHLEEMLKTLADFYESEIEESIKILVSVLEPLLLLMIGGIIGLIAISILAPIYQLVTQF